MLNKLCPPNICYIPTPLKMESAGPDTQGDEKKHLQTDKGQ